MKQRQNGAIHELILPDSHFTTQLFVDRYKLNVGLLVLHYIGDPNESKECHYNFFGYSPNSKNTGYFPEYYDGDFPTKKLRKFPVMIISQLELHDDPKNTGKVVAKQTWHHKTVSY